MKKAEPKVPQQRTELDQIVTRVRTALRRETKNIIEIGELLCSARDLLGHGEWLPWLEKNFEMSQRTAQRYTVCFAYVDMKREMEEEAKSDTVSDFTNLAPGLLYALATTQYNEEEQAAILAATRERRVDLDVATAICEALLDDDEPDEPDEPKAVKARPEDDPEIAAILDGPPPDVPPPTASIAPRNFELEDFDRTVTALMRHVTKPLAHTAGTVHSADDLKEAASYLLAVADRARDSAELQNLERAP